VLRPASCSLTGRCCPPPLPASCARGGAELGQPAAGANHACTLRREQREPAALREGTRAWGQANTAELMQPQAALWLPRPAPVLRPHSPLRSGSHVLTPVPPQVVHHCPIVLLRWAVCTTHTQYSMLPMLVLLEQYSTAVAPVLQEQYSTAVIPVLQEQYSTAVTPVLQEQYSTAVTPVLHERLCYRNSTVWL